MTRRRPGADAPADDPRFPIPDPAALWLEAAPDRPRREAAPFLPPAAGYWFGLGALVGIGVAAVAAGWGLAP